MEVGRSGPSFTIDSVEELLTDLRGARLFLLMASDSWRRSTPGASPTGSCRWLSGPWRRGREARPRTRQLRERFGTAARRIHLLDGPALDMSATQIRRRVAAGRAIRYLVPQAVEEMIVAKGLYRRERPR